MEILRFEESKAASAPKKRGLKSAFGISIVAGLFAVGSTFAATSSITVNGGAPIEFGQGVQYLSTCDTTLDLSVGQTFDPSGGDSTTADFYVGAVTISGINTATNTTNLATNGGCATDDLVFKTYKQNGAQTGYARIKGNNGTSQTFGFCVWTGPDAEQVSDSTVHVKSGDVFAITIESKQSVTGTVSCNPDSIINNDQP